MFYFLSSAMKCAGHINKLFVQFMPYSQDRPYVHPSFYQRFPTGTDFVMMFVARTCHSYCLIARFFLHYFCICLFFISLRQFVFVSFCRLIRSACCYSHLMHDPAVSMPPSTGFFSYIFLLVVPVISDTPTLLDALFPLQTKSIHFFRFFFSLLNVVFL